MPPLAVRAESAGVEVTHAPSAVTAALLDPGPPRGPVQSLPPAATRLVWAETQLEQAPSPLVTGVFVPFALR